MVVSNSNFKRKPFPTLENPKINCRHIWSAFFPKDANANPIKECFFCGLEMGKREHIIRRNWKRRNTRIALSKMKYKHIDLFAF